MAPVEMLLPALILTAPALPPAVPSTVVLLVPLPPIVVIAPVVIAPPEVKLIAPPAWPPLVDAPLVVSAPVDMAEETLLPAVNPPDSTPLVIDVPPVTSGVAVVRLMAPPAEPVPPDVFMEAVLMPVPLVAPAIIVTLPFEPVPLLPVDMVCATLMLPGVSNEPAPEPENATITRLPPLVVAAFELPVKLIAPPVAEPCVESPD